MCYQCYLNASSGPGGVAIADAALELITPKLLISDDFVQFTKTYPAQDGVIKLALHLQGGPVAIGGGGLGEQIIQSRAIPADLSKVIESQIQRLDAWIDLDFIVSSNGSKGDIDFYVDSEIEIGSTTGITLGIALSNVNATRGGWWELLLNGPPLEADRDYLYYAALHELGHSLGLEHPFDASDGDVYQSNQSEFSAYPEQTVMAYRSPLGGGDWPAAFSDSDVEALITIWGPESQSLTTQNDVFQGTIYSEKVNGGRGQDRISGGGGNDLLYGGKDDDLINGNQGDDQIFGNLGDDQLYGGRGDDRLWGNDGSDQIFGNLGKDSLNGGPGNDQLSGGDGADTFWLSAGEDLVTDFSISQGDRLRLPQGVTYEARAVNQTLRISANEGVLLLANAADQLPNLHQWIDFA